MPRGDLVAIGDLMYYEVMQGIWSPRARANVSSLKLSLPRFDPSVFEMAEKSVARLPLVHLDSDVDLMVRHIGLEVL